MHENQHPDEINIYGLHREHSAPQFERPTVTSDMYRCDARTCALIEVSARMKSAISARFTDGHDRSCSESVARPERHLRTSVSVTITQLSQSCP